MFIQSTIFSCDEKEVHSRVVDSVAIAGRDTLRVHISGDVDPKRHAEMLRQIARYLEAKFNEDIA